jgi:Trp operon repressor
MGKRIYYDKEKRPEKLSKAEILDLTFDLINAFGTIKSPSEAADLMGDLLTADEIKDLAKRLRIAKLLVGGKSQREIAVGLHCSLATVTKVSVWLQISGGKLEKVISKLPIKYKMPDNLPKIPIEFQAPQALLATVKYVLAKSQDKITKRFTEKVQIKKLSDKTLQEQVELEFKSKRNLT